MDLFGSDSGTKNIVRYFGKIVKYLIVTFVPGHVLIRVVPGWGGGGAASLRGARARRRTLGCRYFRSNGPVVDRM